MNRITTSFFVSTLLCFWLLNGEKMQLGQQLLVALPKQPQKRNVHDVVLPAARSAESLEHGTVLKPVLQVESMPSASAGIKERIGRLNANLSPTAVRTGIAKPFGWREGSDDVTPHAQGALPAATPLPVQSPVLPASKPLNEAAAATKIQAAVRGYQERFAQARKQLGAIEMQSLFRGFRARKQVQAQRQQEATERLAAEKAHLSKQEEANLLAAQAAEERKRKSFATYKTLSPAEQIKWLKNLPSEEREQFYAMQRAQQARIGAAKATAQQETLPGVESPARQEAVQVRAVQATPVRAQVKQTPASAPAPSQERQKAALEKHMDRLKKNSAVRAGFNSSDTRGLTPGERGANVLKKR